MPRELVYTAADEGVDGLRGCLCYAGASSDALSNKLLLQNLLAINNYQELYKAGDPRANNNPIGFSHYRFNAGARDCSVISRIGPAPLYANRTNFIANHVILDDNEKAKAGPAWAIKNFKFRDQWSSQNGRLDNPRLLIGSLDPQTCNYWKSISGEPGWAGWLAERAQSGKHTTVLYPTLSDPMNLIQEAIALLPEYQRWNITFSTYYTLGGRGPNCTLRFIPLDADSLAAPFYDKTFHDGVLNLARSLGSVPAGALVNLARGEKPKDKAILSGLGVPSGSSFIPNFDPIKSDLPGFLPTKDPLYSKSELFIDTKTNFESFDNLKSSGPDNTWKTIKFLAGILGLLFLLVLPPLLTWLISSSINHEELSKLKNDKNNELNNLVKDLGDLEEIKNEKIEGVLALFDIAEILKNENDKLGKQVDEQNKLYMTKNIEEFKNLDDLKFKLNDSKFNGITGFKIPKNIIEDLLKTKGEQEKLIIRDGPKDKESWVEFVDKNKGKVLEKGDGISNYINRIEKNAKEKYESYGNIQKYFKAKQWIDNDKVTLKSNEYLEQVKKGLLTNVQKIKADKIFNAHHIILPLANLVALNILIKNNPGNLFLMNEFQSDLDELVKVLLDVKKERPFSKSEKVTEYVKSNGKSVSDIFAPTNLENMQFRTVGPFTFSKADWDKFIKEFEAHLENLNNTELNVEKKLIAMIEFTKMQLSVFLQGKIK